MDDALPKLLSFPPHPPPKTPMSNEQYDEAIKAHISNISAIQDKVLTTPTSGGESPLDVIDPGQNTVSYIYTLLAHTTDASRAGKGPKTIETQALCQKIEIFMSTMDGRQIRYLGTELKKVLDFFFKVANNSQQTQLSVSLICDAILKLDPSGAMLTSRHIQLVELAYSTRNYVDALPVLEKHILYFPGTLNQPKAKYLCDLDLAPTSYVTPAFNQTGKLKYQDVLNYFLWRGMIFIGLRRWEDAQDSLLSAITFPIRGDASLSRIMVEAYKKWILVGVLANGKLPNMPKSTSSTGVRLYSTAAKPYETLATIFETGTAGRLKSEADIGQTIWAEDCNTGLVLSVLAAYQKFQIRNLANVYARLSLKEVQDLTTSAENGGAKATIAQLTSIVNEMISNRTLDADLSHPASGPAILTFVPGASFSEEVMQKKLAEATEHIQTLTVEIKNTDRLLTFDKDHIKAARKMHKQAKNSMLDADQGIAGDMDWHAEDEDLMV